ncbi:hypothetical protein MXEN_20070 [Mycobacterium xenopi RIVM700367]|nr:hypothetical protein MXEN_20070 [Mycobacterium xenopi RIVM700367]
MKLISPTDSMFLLGESREHPMHVGSLQLFQPPAHAGAEFVREAYEAMLGCTDVQPTFRKHPAFFGPGSCPSGGVKEFGRRFRRRRASLKEGAYVRVEEDIACPAVAG